MARLTPEQHSLRMAAVRGKNTKPEMIVRRLVHSIGYRYRLHASHLAGKPDLVFASKKKVIFVHGCFWHRHGCRRGQSQPRTKKAFWRTKFKGNVARDQRNLRHLRGAGWKVLVLWECEMADTDKLRQRVIKFLG